MDKPTKYSYSIALTWKIFLLMQRLQIYVNKVQKEDDFYLIALMYKRFAVHTSKTHIGHSACGVVGGLCVCE
jgi:hypothetical protein